MEGIIAGIAKIIVETDEETPVTIAQITENEINVADGYRVRMKPDDQCSVSLGGLGNKNSGKARK
nr:MAG TPA: hypothetical protein [Caudoviricetes sp.]